MNSSVKSLVPMVTVGLPLPGCDDDDELPELLLLPLLLLLLLLPHAASSAAVASSATAPPIRGLDTSRCSFVLGRYLDAFGRGNDAVDLLGERDARWGDGALDQGQQAVHRERQSHDDDRRGDHAGHVVGRLVDDDVAEG